MAGTPDTYDAVKVTVSPQDLQDTSQKVKSLVDDIVNHLNTINTTLNDLQLSWVGQSSSLADSFNKQWMAATATLYGTQDHPEQGVLNHLLAGLEAASSNYSFVEDWAKKGFGTLVSALNGGGGGQSTSSPTSVENSSGSVTTAITETF